MGELPYGYAESVARLGNLVGLRRIKEELLSEISSIEAVYLLSQLMGVQARDGIHAEWVRTELSRKGKSLCQPFVHLPYPIWEGNKIFDPMAEIDIVGEIYCSTMGAAGNKIEVRAGVSGVIDIKIYDFDLALCCHLVFSFASQMIAVPVATSSVRDYPSLIKNIWFADGSVFGYALGLALLRRMDWENDVNARLVLASMQDNQLLEYRQRSRPQDDIEWVPYHKAIVGE